jgi:hypothetical protein
LFIVGGSFFALAQPAAAATITVNGTTCTLANAITAANTDRATGGCPAGSGADTLTLTADVTLSAALPAIASNVTIHGNTPTRFVSGNQAFRVFYVQSGTVTFKDLTIRNGQATGGNGSKGAPGNGAGGGGLGAGGGIYVNSGNITVENVTFVGNVAQGGAGGAGTVAGGTGAGGDGPGVIGKGGDGGRAVTGIATGIGGIGVGIGGKGAGLVPPNKSHTARGGTSTFGGGGGGGLAAFPAAAALAPAVRSLFALAA